MPQQPPPNDDLHITERHGRTLDNYHVWQRDTNDCGPHVVAMAINFWRGNDERDATAIAQEMNRPRVGVDFPPLVVRRIPNWATFPWGMVDMLRLHGIPARWRFLASEDHLFRALDQNRLVMPIYGEPFRRIDGRWRGWSHVVHLIGWDAERQQYLFVDSSQRVAPTTMPRDDFLRKWRNMGRLLVETR